MLLNTYLVAFDAAVAAFFAAYSAEEDAMRVLQALHDVRTWHDLKPISDGESLGLAVSESLMGDHYIDRPCQPPRPANIEEHAQNLWNALVGLCSTITDQQITQINGSGYEDLRLPEAITNELRAYAGRGQPKTAQALTYIIEGYQPPAGALHN